jgi:hypothetical protein
MDNRDRVFSPKRHGFSRKSLLVGAVFILTLTAAVFIDVDALLEYFRVISGSPGSALELGAIVTAASAAPLLAMGMCIADDELHRND